MEQRRCHKSRRTKTIAMLTVFVDTSSLSHSTQAVMQKMHLHPNVVPKRMTAVRAERVRLSHNPSVKNNNLRVKMALGLSPDKRMESYSLLANRRTPQRSPCRVVCPVP